MSIVRGKANFNAANLANCRNNNKKNDLSFTANPQEIEILRRKFVVEKKPQAAEILTYLAESSKEERYSLTNSFLQSAPIKIIKDFVEAASAKKEKLVASTVKGIKESKRYLDETTAQIDRLLHIPANLKDFKLVQNLSRAESALDASKSKLAEKLIPYNTDDTIRRVYFDFESPQVMAENRVNKHFHRMLEKKYFKKNKL